jgi:hypothetical protein
VPSDNLGQGAYHIVEELAVHIGPRPAGSDGERRALDYVENELRKTCQKVSRTPVTGIPGPSTTRVLMLGGMAFLTYCVYGLVESPQDMLIYLVAFFAIPKLISQVRKRVSTRAGRKSENVIGYLPAAQEGCDRLVLCAHLDSAKATRVPGGLWPRINRLWMRALVPFVFLMAGAATLRWLDMRFSFAPLIVWQTIRAIGLAFAVFSLIFQMIYLYLSRGNVYSPGANDNASGVAVVLALAQHVHEASLAHLDMYYALFTAEETGLVGSQQFAKGTSLPKENTYVVNLDMVGTGRRLCYVRGSGLLPPRFTDRYLNALLRECYPSIKPHYYFMGDSDFASFLAKGFRATSLLTMGDDRAETVYHTDRDTINYIDAASLQLTASVVAKMMRLLDERIGDEVGGSKLVLDSG